MYNLPPDDPNHPINVKQQAPEEFASFLDGRQPDGKHRHCTDCLCLLLLLACWIAMTTLGIDALVRGDPALLINGVDEQGRICGIDSGVKGASQWVLASWSGAGICVNKCPTVNNWNDISSFDPADIDELLCRENAGNGTWYADYPFYLVYYGDCMYQFKTSNFLNYCILEDLNLFSDVFSTLYDFDDSFSVSYIYERANNLTKTFSDIFAVFLFICLFGFVVSFVIATAYNTLLTIPCVAKLVVWGSVWSVFLFSLASAGYAHFLAKKFREEVPQVRGDNEIETVQVLAYIGFGFSLFWLCLILYLRDRIRLAVGLVVETARALNKIPALIIAVPIMQVVGLVAFTLPWLFFVIYMASLGDVETKKSKAAGFEVNYKEINYSTQQSRAAWFMLFGYFWTAEFIEAFGQTITAMCMCCYYFTRDKSRINNLTICHAVRIVTRYHLGTLAFGSILVAIVRLIRAYLRYMEKYAMRNRTCIQKILLKCIHCCMWCIERCIKYINANAYIQTCIWGTSFCASAFNAFWLIFRNLARVAAVTGVTHFLVIIGKVMVVVLTSGWFYYVMDTYYADTVNNLVLPTVVVAVLATFVASMFFEVFGMGTTTLLQCFIADEEMFKDHPEGAFAENALQDYLLAHGKAKVKRAAKKQKASLVIRQEGRRKETPRHSNRKG